MPQNSNFRRPGGHRLFPKIGSYGYGAKSRWGPPRVHLGANGVPLGPKNGSKPLKITMPQNSSFRLTRSHRFFTKNGIYGFEAKSRWGHPRGHLGANRVPLGPKNGSKRRKLPCPKIVIFDYPAVIDFSPKMEVSVIAPNLSGDPLGSILGPMGSHWVKKMGQNRKKLTCPKIRIFDYPAVIDFSQKMEVSVIAPNHSGDPLGSILGPMGSHWVQKMGQNGKKLTCPKVRIFDYRAVIDFSQKWKLRLWRQIMVGTP